MTKPTAPPALKDVEYQFSRELFSDLIDVIPADLSARRFRNLVWDLEDLVANYQAGLMEKEGREYREECQLRKHLAQQIEKEIGAALAALNALDDASRSEFVAFGLKGQGRRNRAARWKAAITPLQTVLDAARRWEAALKHDGRPVTPMSILAWYVGRALHKRGLPLKKSRDGMLSRTLAIVFEAADCKVPEDLFYHAGKVVDAFRVRTKIVPSVK